MWRRHPRPGSGGAHASPHSRAEASGGVAFHDGANLVPSVGHYQPQAQRGTAIREVDLRLPGAIAIDFVAARSRPPVRPDGNAVDRREVHLAEAAVAVEVSHGHATEESRLRSGEDLPVDGEPVVATQRGLAARVA